MAANTLIEVLVLCNGAQIYLDQYDVTRGKLGKDFWSPLTRLCDLT